jgi:hypothetical protein
VQSKDAHTQYFVIPAVMVQDSQYPFGEGERVRITIDTSHERMIIESIMQEPQVKVSPGFFSRKSISCRSFSSNLSYLPFISHPSVAKSGTIVHSPFFPIYQLLFRENVQKVELKVF